MFKEIEFFYFFELKKWFCFDCHFHAVWDRKFWFVPSNYKFYSVSESIFVFVFWTICYKIRLKTHALFLEFRFFIFLSKTVISHTNNNKMLKRVIWDISSAFFRIWANRAHRACRFQRAWQSFSVPEYFKLVSLQGKETIHQKRKKDLQRIRAKRGNKKRKKIFFLNMSVRIPQQSHRARQQKTGTWARYKKCSTLLQLLSFSTQI